MKLLPFNINYVVRVKLTPLGIEALRKNHEEFMAKLPPAGRRAWTPPTIDEDGFYHAQMWGLMHDLGPHMFIGASGPCETEIYLEVPADAEYMKFTRREDV